MMYVKVFLRRLRGALGNAVFWGLAWFVIGFVVIAAESLLASGTIFLPGLIAQSVFAGLIGSITGGVFSAYVAARFRHMRVEDLKAGQFALGGAFIGVLSAFVWPLENPHPSGTHIASHSAYSASNAPVQEAETRPEIRGLGSANLLSAHGLVLGWVLEQDGTPRFKILTESAGA